MQSQLPKTRVKLSGILLSLESYNISPQFAQIDLSSVKEAGEYTFKVKYNLPSSFVLLEKEVENVTLTITEKNIEEDDNLENTDEQNGENIENSENSEGN